MTTLFSLSSEMLRNNNYWKNGTKCSCKKCFQLCDVYGCAFNQNMTCQSWGYYCPNCETDDIMKRNFELNIKYHQLELEYEKLKNKVDLIKNEVTNDK